MLGNALVYGNAAAHEKCDKSYLKEVWKETGIDCVTLPKNSLELNPIELVLKTMVQRFNATFNVTMISTCKGALNLLRNAADSIHGDMTFYYYEKFRHNNFH